MPGFGAKFPQNWSLGYAYGPEGHPFEVGTTSHSSNAATTDFQYDSLFWDDDAMLFSEDAQGNIDDVKIGTLADFQAHAGLASGQSGPLLSVIDRDLKGQTIGCHASDGSTSAASAYRPWLYGSGPICIASPGTIGRGGVLRMPRTDGLFDGWNTVQGVRSYDAQAGIWNTPDAYRGDVHDPMSQKPYMWNRNNPYEYGDPSGYCVPACALAPEIVVGGAVVLAGAAYLTGNQHLHDASMSLASEVQTRINDAGKSLYGAAEGLFKKKDPSEQEHTSNTGEATRAKHELGQTRRAEDYGGEKGDDARRANGQYPRRPPAGFKGPWPPRVPRK